ncbi:uncharacterized protein LOC126835307 isoform X2 [Adelges cooleyi]|uniref:uncharacterized protein LOC126835307 isoform X2 n=1 Tax=Adelges cooleyi TaxID=133065 RepID=UPI00217F8D07|nr:uncharacterized protein LOC126835307 isoform X2 [Adelges cooleyi]
MANDSSWTTVESSTTTSASYSPHARLLAELAQKAVVNDILHCTSEKNQLTMHLWEELAVIICLTATAVFADGRYSKEGLIQKQNKYNSWAPNRAGLSDWSYSGGVPSSMMRHYPVSLSRYQQVIADAAAAAAANRQQQHQMQPLTLSEYYDAALAAITGEGVDLNPSFEPRVYGPRTPYDARQSYDPRQTYDTRSNEVSNYAVVRYPSYSYYPPAVEGLSGSGRRFDGGNEEDDNKESSFEDRLRMVLNEDESSGRDDPMLMSSYYHDEHPASLESRFRPQQYYWSSPPRYNSADKIHKYRNLFMSNPVSPSNAFKSAKEQELHDFWESLIQGDLQKPSERDPYARHKQLQMRQQAAYEAKQQFRQQQKLAGQDDKDDSDDDGDRMSSNSRPSLYSQWANGSPLIKRSLGNADNDDVRQLEQLKWTATPTTMTAAKAITTTPAVTGPMADGGQREYVLPRPASEKSGLESLLEVIAEGGVHGLPTQPDMQQLQLHQVAKVNKKRSLVSDETSLAAELGALRKN